ncbi:MAG TPA: ABC transporter permease, partial [Gaiellaceae bacterium]|nr:ABC transporter permease [Gaiellaceae bacterium]
FKCGLFNIGGQGQYIVGAFIGVWVGSSWASMSSGLHIFLAIFLAALAGAAWAAIAGFLKATVGVHEVISTIMLNWIAYWVIQALIGQGGQLQNTTDKSVPISSDIVDKAHLPVFWGDPVLQGLHVGFFIALGAPIVYWLLLNRTTLGYEVRATGFNPEAARYGGVNVRRSYVLAMAISGTFAGLAGAIDILGWQFRLGVIDVQVSQIGFIGIAVALLGRNSAIGVPLAALLFGSLLQGTSTRNPAIQDVIKPELAGNLTLIIQGLVLLFIGADVFFLWIWQLRRKVARRKSAPLTAKPEGSVT